MPTENKNRAIKIMKYLWDNTDDNHSATINDIMSYLNTVGIVAGRKTIALDIEQLQESGCDIVCNRSRQNQYFWGSRGFELPEIKLLTDAVETAKFMSPKKSAALIKKLTQMAGPYHDGEIGQQAYINEIAKTTNENILYIVDLLCTAIRERKRITFKYYEYSADKEKVFKHNGQIYTLSPYNLAWNSDHYYILGFSESHNKVVKFRVDLMYMPKITNGVSVKKPQDYDVAEFFKQVFQMYDGEKQTVELLCENTIMKNVIDRFGEKVETRRVDCNKFIATVDVSVSPTFFAWVFTYAGKIKISSPQNVVDEYLQHLRQAISNA